MIAKAIVLTLVLYLVGAAVCFAQDTQMGTWKLNEAKSKLASGGPKNTMVVCAAAGDDVKVTVDGVGGDGKPTHNDGRASSTARTIPVTRDPTSDERSYMKIDDRTLGLNLQNGGKNTISGRIAVSVDGKTRTVTVSGTDPTGKKFQSSAVYDKQ